MRWFKHMSDASDDNFMEELEDKFGLDGYGRWWKMLEVIAKSMDETDRCYAEHSWIKWQSYLKGKRNKLETFLEHCQNKNKIKTELNGNILKIICPKLLELRDEYSRKSGHKKDKPPDEVAATDNRQHITDLEYKSLLDSPREVRIVDNYSNDANLNDLTLCVNIFCDLYSRIISPAEQTTLAIWCDKYDMRVAFLIIEYALHKFRQQHGKNPETVNYFDKVLKSELMKTPMLLRSPKGQHQATPF